MTNIFHIVLTQLLIFFFFQTQLRFTICKIEINEPNIENYL